MSYLKQFLAVAVCVHLFSRVQINAVELYEAGTVETTCKLQPPMNI